MSRRSIHRRTSIPGRQRCDAPAEGGGRHAGRVLFADRRAGDVRGRGRDDGLGLQGALGSGPGPDPEPARHRRRARMRVPHHARAWPVAAHRQLPPEEAPPGRAARTGAARRLGVLLRAPRRGDASGEGLRAGGGAGMSEIRERVREHYRTLALVKGDACGSPCCAGEPSGIGPELYDALERAELPDAAAMASLGCGNPLLVAELRPGETVLDLGSGGGIDVLLSARRVGPSGRAFGLDMTDEILEQARLNAEDAGVANAEFLKGYIEEIPLPDESVDVVISNCVINLSADKATVFGEMRRVLRPSGRVGVSDIVAGDELSPADRATRGSFVGCIAGALSFAEYRSGLERAGFDDVNVDPTHAVADGMYGAIVGARRP